MMPLPELLDGLGRGRLEVVEKALALHHKAFKAVFLRSLLGGLSSGTEEHITRMAILFETIMNCLKKSDKNSSFLVSIRNVTIDHCKTLLQELNSFKIPAFSSSIQQKKAVIELLNFHLNDLQDLPYEAPEPTSPTETVVGTNAHACTSSNVLGENQDNLCDKDAKPNMYLTNASNFLFNNLSSKSDEDVVRHAVLSSDAVACAEQVLLARAKRSRKEMTEYFQSVANKYVIELLEKKQLETAKDVLHNTDRDIWPSLKSICLNTVNSNIRDFLATELKSLGLLETAELDVLKFLILIDGVLNKTNLEVCILEDHLKLQKMSCESSSSISINSILNLSDSCRERALLLAALYFETLNGTLEPMLCKDHCWIYLLSNNRLEVLIEWIKASCSQTSKYNTEGRLAKFLLSWNITQDMIDLIPSSSAPTVSKECLLDYLSKFGLFSTTEVTNVHQRLLRMIRTGQIFSTWDESVQTLFVEFCIQSNMPDLLVSSNLKTDRTSPAWIKFYTKFQKLSDEPLSRSALQESVDLSADYLKIESSTEPLLYFASFLLSDQTLIEALDETSVDAEKRRNLLKALNLYPQLLELLQNSTQEQRVPDISLQCLLKKKFLSNSRHEVLKQQSLCNMFKLKQEKSEVHFSHEPTINLYGLQETLDFQYYLKQGRPCHAALLVIANVIRNYGKPSRKLWRRPIMSAHELAFLNTSNQMITASCIAFLEMLGESSILLRTHLAVINLLESLKADPVFRYKHNDKFGESSIHGSLATGIQNHLEVYELLQSHLPFDVHKQGLAVQFANLHKLPLPTRFLAHCAMNNDWVTFLVFSQIYGYTPEIVMRIVRQFQSAAIRDHLETFISRYFSSTSKSLKTLQVPPRVSDQPNTKTSDRTPDSSSSLSSEGVSSVPLVTSSAKENLFEILLICHNSCDPAEALLHSCVELPCPILAAFAECYKTNPEAQLVAWLASWLPQRERVVFDSWRKNVPWPFEVIRSLVARSMEISRSNLCLGFNIFLPDHPLILILNVIEKFSTHDFTSSVDSLTQFKEVTKNLKKLTVEPWCLDNSDFVHDLGAKLVLLFVDKLETISLKKSFLEILCEANFSFHSHGESCDLQKLVFILDALVPSGVQINVCDYLNDSRKEIDLCTEKLISLGFYKEAASISGNSHVIAEQKHKLEKWLQSSYQDFKEFCKECNTRFDEAMISPSEAGNFFRECATVMTKNIDRWRAMWNCLKWMERSELVLSHSDMVMQKNTIEKEMWMCCIQNDDSSIYSILEDELHHCLSKDLRSELLGIKVLRFTEAFHQCSVTCDEATCPQRLIDCLLDIGDIVSASHVHCFFESNHRDFEVLKICISLAEGTLGVHEVPTYCGIGGMFHSLPNSDTDKPLPIFSSILRSKWNTSGCPQKSSTLSDDKLEVLSAIQVLVQQLKHGREIGKQVLASYRLALNLELSYQNIIAITDPLKILRIAISQSYSEDLSVVSDIMLAMRFSPAERAKFLSREIIAAISKGPDIGNVKVYCLWGHDIEQYFQFVLQLLPDPSLLGSEIMIMVNELAIYDKNTPKTVLDTTVELLVRAHDCFTASCHMEGISEVLRTVSSFSLILKTRAEWALMVRLLTGIQRYTEMKYIFKMLKENDQFEYFLRKDSAKPLSFKLAIFDWLRRECAHDTALLKMTVAHFKMHQQEAELWQKEGFERLRTVLDNRQGLLNNQITKAALQMTLQDYSHASECYLQANMLNHAVGCAHQAELVALQLYLLSSQLDGDVLQVILLNARSVSEIIVTRLSFHQALIVARAYNNQPDWAAVLFYHCIHPALSAEEYFLSWSSCMELTPSIAQNIAYRLQRTPAVTREMMSKMQWILGHVKEIDARYKIASELGLKDMVESLLQAPEVAYLKDTVWQSGFKR